MNAEEFLKQCAPDVGAEGYSPLILAYIGDAVFELLVRSSVVAGGNKPVNELNRQSASLVKAPSQAAMYHKIEEKLTEEEAAVLKRGRNAKSFTHAKNASITDYRHATGLEALFGYLYLKGRIERIFELFGLCLDETIKPFRTNTK
jgi:ribonuclease-3 family protein